MATVAGNIMGGTCIALYSVSMENRLVPWLLNTISCAAACSGVYLSGPLDSPTNWLSSAVTWCSGIPVTRPAVLPRVVPIHLPFRSKDGVWQDPWLPPFGLPACPPLSAFSLSDWRLQSICEVTQTDLRRRATCKWHSRTRELNVCSVRKFTKGKHRSWEAGCVVKLNPELNVNSLQREKLKKHAGQCFTVPLHKGSSTLIHRQRAGDTLAIISVRQGPLSRQFFQGRFNLHLREYFSASSLLRWNKRLLKLMHF